MNKTSKILIAIIFISAFTFLSFRCKKLETELNNSNDTITQLENEILNNNYEDIVYKCELIENIKQYDKKTYLILYKDIINKYSELDPPETIYDYFSDEQIKIMLKCIETETFECNFDAKVNVANVILNRVENELYPTDPIEIIKGDNQFAYGRNNITEDTILALEYAFMIEDTTNGCIGFRSDCSPKIWNGWEYQFTDSVGHNFYK